MNQKEAMGEVPSPMESWRSSASAKAAPRGHFRLLTPGAGAGRHVSKPAARRFERRIRSLARITARIGRQAAESKRLIDIRNAELS